MDCINACKHGIPWCRCLACGGHDTLVTIGRLRAVLGKFIRTHRSDGNVTVLAMMENLRAYAREAGVDLDVCERTRPVRCTRTPDGTPGIRDMDFPCEDFAPGEPSMTADCETDGHHLCRSCSNRKPDDTEAPDA